MTHCPVCDEETSERIEMMPGGMTRKVCPRGHALEQPEGLRRAADQSAIGFVDDEGVPVQFGFPGMGVPQASHVQPKPTHHAKAAEPLNALKAIRERRKWLKGEIKRLRALEVEDRELAAAQHAVAAARRAGVVTPLRTAQ